MKLPFQKQASSRDLPVRRRHLNEGVAPDAELASGSATFRRNSTITGSSSVHVASASELSGQLQSPRATAHHLHRQRRHLGLLLLGALVSAAMLIVLIYQFIGSVSISLYGQIKPVSAAEQQLYQEKTVEYLNRYPLQRLRFLFNQDQLSDFLQAESLSEIKSVSSVQNDGLGSAVITVKMREPIASWLIQGDRQYVDADGVVFARNYFNEPAVEIRDESNFTHKEGQQVQAVTSRRFLQFIGRTVKYYDQHDFVVKQVTIPSSATRQVIVTLQGGYNLRMTVDRPAGEQAEDGLRAVKYFKRKHIKPEYADVRVAGRVFYR